MKQQHIGRKDNFLDFQILQNKEKKLYLGNEIICVEKHVTLKYSGLDVLSHLSNGQTFCDIETLLHTF